MFRCLRVSSSVQPEDPARCRNSRDVQEHKYFPIFRTREWKQFAKAYKIEFIHFDASYGTCQEKTNYTCDQ